MYGGIQTAHGLSVAKQEHAWKNICHLRTSFHIQMTVLCLLIIKIYFQRFFFTSEILLSESF